MRVISITAIYILIGIGCLSAQGNGISELLHQVEEHNQTLQVYRAQMESEKLASQTINYLPDPQASAYFLPFGNHETKNYWEFEISQSMEFPSVYAARSKWIEKHGEKLQAEYQKLRQDILLEAVQLSYEMIHLHNRRALNESRMSEARKVYEHTKTMYEKGETGILEFNKAKVAWLKQQFEVEEIETERKKILNRLERLNGYRELTIELKEYPAALHIADMDSIWQEKSTSERQIEVLNKEVDLARQNITGEKNKLLPDLTLGYNYQGVPSSNYSGFFGGVSLPVWSGNKKVEHAKSLLAYREEQRDAAIHELKSEFRESYMRYEFLLDKYSEYKEALDGLQSASLLQRSYELGEISFLEYYREVQFYREAMDSLLEIEKEMHQLRAELFKHQL